MPCEHSFKITKHVDDNVIEICPECLYNEAQQKDAEIKKLNEIVASLAVNNKIIIDDDQDNKPVVETILSIIPKKHWRFESVDHLKDIFKGMKCKDLPVDEGKRVGLLMHILMDNYGAPRLDGLKISSNVVKTMIKLVFNLDYKILDKYVYVDGCAIEYDILINFVPNIEIIVACHEQINYMRPAAGRTMGMVVQDLLVSIKKMYDESKY
jgi:hypothetical protein